jgi:hypothetical protein
VNKKDSRMFTWKKGIFFWRRNSKEWWETVYLTRRRGWYSGSWWWFGSFFTCLWTSQSLPQSLPVFSFLRWSRDSQELFSLLSYSPHQFLYWWWFFSVSVCTFDFFFRPSHHHLRATELLEMEKERLLNETPLVFCLFMNFIFGRCKKRRECFQLRGLFLKVPLLHLA